MKTYKVKMRERKVEKLNSILTNITEIIDIRILFGRVLRDNTAQLALLMDPPLVFGCSPA